jgi:hypothetical protein
LEREVKKGTPHQIKMGRSHGEKEVCSKQDRISCCTDFVVIREKRERVVMVRQKHKRPEVSDDYRKAGAVLVFTEQPQNEWQTGEHGNRN